MPAPSFAHLLLPTPLGLVHYDLLEEAAFLGLDAKGRFVASPTPFPTAKLAMTADGGSFLVRALPGEAPAEINGVPADGKRLAEGDRIRLGGETAQFRAAPHVPRAVVSRPTVVISGSALEVLPAGGAPAAGQPAVGAPPAPRRAPPPPRPQASSGAKNASFALKVLGAGVFVFAIYQTLQFLDRTDTVRMPPWSDEWLPKGPQAISHPEEKATRAYDAAHDLETIDLAGAVDRLRAVAKDFPTTSAAGRANARVAELYPTLAAREWKPLEDVLSSLMNAQKFRRALELLTDFERRFAGTEPAAKIPERIAAVYEQARIGLDAVVRRASANLPKEPKRAYATLLDPGLELPPDLEAERAALLAEVRTLVFKASPQRPPGGEGPGGTPPPRPPPPPKKPKPGTELMPPDGSQPPPDDPGGAPAPPDTAQGKHEEEARVAFDKAKADLDAKNWEAARKAFSGLLKQFSDTSLVQGRMERIRAARKLADFGLRGPAAFLKGEAEFKGGRLEVEYEFEDDVAFQADFTLEQPFASEEQITASVRSGMVVLSGSTTMLNKVVFDPADLVWEMECVADRHEDYGLFGLQESKDYRAVVFDVGNTQFKLKKGDAAKVLSGHVLWLFGEGVWKDADPGERGFVRIAEKSGNKLDPGDRLKVRLELKGGQATASFHGKSDTLELKGALKGDDGRGIGPLRVGSFAFKGRVGVDRIKISGKPDPAWVDKQVEDLTKAAAGPN